ncbi:hypothetical protein L596_018121 [Steinernema carpocapsae]|uniref:Uncharacterized protein n=1 Tax=Steinernema carpocapsae TaxID=34508 RepID=A0A4U5N4F3_STECR|nr:hypothetical protein L596_018121 [Steinernema carpocapsae]
MEYRLTPLRSPVARSPTRLSLMGGLVSKSVCFAAGGYAGAYAAQNYEIPKIPAPQEVYKAVEEYLQKYKKD